MPGEAITVIGHLQPAPNRMPGDASRPLEPFITQVKGGEPFLIYAGSPERMARRLGWMAVHFLFLGLLVLLLVVLVF